MCSHIFCKNISTSFLYGFTNFNCPIGKVWYKMSKNKDKNSLMSNEILRNIFYFLFEMPLTQRASTQFLLLLLYSKEYVRSKKNEIKLEAPQKNSKKLFRAKKLNMQGRWKFVFLPKFSPNSLHFNGAISLPLHTV